MNALTRMCQLSVTFVLTASLGWSQLQEEKLVASDAAVWDWFGFAVALDGETAVIGAPHDDDPNGWDAGSAYVFARSAAGGWSEVAKLAASDGAAYESFGRSVSIARNTIVVGSDSGHAGLLSGAVYVFERDQGGPDAWGEVAKLTASDAATGDGFGYTLAVWGDTIVVGAPYKGGTGAGRAYFFERNPGGGPAWVEVAKLNKGGAGAFFGSSVALFADTAVIGASWDEHSGLGTAGSAFVLERHQGGAHAWGAVAKLNAADPGAGDQFGASVALDGDTVVVGAPQNNHAAGVDAGSTYVFERDQGGPGAWGQVVELVASDAAAGDLFGLSLDLDGDALLVGSLRDQVSGSSSNEGAAYRFERDHGGPGAWGESDQLVAQDAGAGDQFGHSVGLSCGTALVGAWLDDHAGGQEAGSAYAFSSPLVPGVYCTAGTSASGCRASISAAGTASSTASSGFHLLAVDVEGAKEGLFFFGTNGRQAKPWGNGTSYRCVVPPVKRGGLLPGMGAPGTCAGAFAQDLNAHWCPTCAHPAHNPGVGALVQAQLWYRDPFSTNNQTTSFSDAIEFCVSP